jgi:hypothetical protein
MKTKLFSICIVFSILAILLAACSGANATAVSTTTTTNDSLSPVTRLAVGTLKLEGTDQAVTAEQATQLLTLWQAYQSFSTDATTAQVELDALVTQIQGLMTTEQIQAIEAMGLTGQSVSEVVQSLGVSVSKSDASGAQTAQTSGQAFPAGGPGGDMGGMPTGGGGMPMGDDLGIGMTAQSTADTTQSQSTAQTTPDNTMLLNAVISLLETRSQGTISG